MGSMIKFLPSIYWITVILWSSLGRYRTHKRCLKSCGGSITFWNSPWKLDSTTLITLKQGFNRIYQAAFDLREMNYIECLSFQNDRSLFILVIFPDGSIDKAVVRNTALIQLKIHCCAQNPHDPGNKSLGITNIPLDFQCKVIDTELYVAFITKRHGSGDTIRVFQYTPAPKIQLWRCDDPITIPVPSDQQPSC